MFAYLLCYLLDSCIYFYMFYCCLLLCFFLIYSLLPIIVSLDMSSHCRYHCAVAHPSSPSSKHNPLDSFIHSFSVLATTFSILYLVLSSVTLPNNFSKISPTFPFLLSFSHPTKSTHFHLSQNVLIAFPSVSLLPTPFLLLITISAKELL